MGCLAEMGCHVGHDLEAVVAVPGCSRCRIEADDGMGGTGDEGMWEVEGAHGAWGLGLQRERTGGACAGRWRMMVMGVAVVSSGIGWSVGVGWGGGQ